MSSEEPKDQLLELPDEVKAELEKHRQEYEQDPENAHYWDPIVIGVAGGPVSTLLLHYTGRKSGKKYNTVLQYYRMDGQFAVIASRGGTLHNPTWYLNLVSSPECEIQVGSQHHKANARTVEGQEYHKWRQFVDNEQPVQKEYQARTSRIIPIVVFDIID